MLRLAFALVLYASAALAQSMPLMGAGLSSPTVATTAWNPSDKSASLTLSNNNLTATAAAGSQGVRAVASHSSGKYYYEATCTLSGTNPFSGIGALDATGSLTANAPGSQAGHDTPGIKTGGDVWHNNTFVVTMAATGTNISGYTIRMAIDLDNHKAWFKLEGAGSSGKWNDDAIAVGENPSTNTGGIAIGSLTDFPMVNLFNTNDTCTANFGGSAYGFTVPTGFGNW